MTNKWKRVLSLVLSLLMTLSGSAFAEGTGLVYTAEEQEMLAVYADLFDNGFGLFEPEAEYAAALEKIIDEEVAGQNADGGAVWQKTDDGWAVENMFGYAFAGETADAIAELTQQLGVRLFDGGFGVAIGEGEEIQLPTTGMDGHADLFAYAMGTAEEPKLMVGAIGAQGNSNAVVIGRNAQTGAWEIEMQVTVIGGTVVLNAGVAAAKVDTDGTIWLDGSNGAQIIVFEDGESSIRTFDEYGELITEAHAASDDPAAGYEDLAAALNLAARCSIMWGEGGSDDADSLSLQDMLADSKCTFCGGEGQHMTHGCTKHCILDGGEHGLCELCGEHKCNNAAHGTNEGECGHIAAGPSKAPAAPSPTAKPTLTPTVAPTAAPTAEPTEEPTAAPTVEPTAAPTEEPGIGGDVPGLPFAYICENCTREVPEENHHKAECGCWYCDGDWFSDEHKKCGGCGLYRCDDEYAAMQANHVQCGGCGIYDCTDEYGEFSHPQCANCEAWLCVEDEDEHLICLGCEMFRCADGYVSEDHETCPSCGMYECEEGYNSYEHEICLCGEYRCAGPEHMPCPRCTVPPCSEYYGEPEDHAQCEICGAYACDYDYDPEDHTECDLCGLIKCDPDHDHIYHHAYGKDRCLCMLAHDHTTSRPVIGEDGDVEDHYPLPCCGKCAYEHNAEDHVPADCGTEGHWNCDGDLHEQCEGCGEWLCGEGVDPAEHDYCYNCEVYFCEEEYAHIIHYYYDDGDCRCSLKHDGYSAQPWSVNEEGVEAHFALDCCGRCNVEKSSHHGEPAECGKEGHIECTYGPHDVCRGCGAKACDEGYDSAEHKRCPDPECGERICNGANHSQAPCGHYYCAIGDSTAWHNGCSGCGRYACSGNYDDYTHNCPECGECYLSVHATPHVMTCMCGDTMCSITDPSEHAYCSVCKEYICCTSGKEAHAEMSCGHKACQPACSSSPEGSHPRHTQICEHCDRYMCYNRTGGHNLYDCGMHWTCVGGYDSRRHEKLPCGVHSKCEVNESEWALHGACDGGCGAKLCQIDAEDRPLHEICAFCGLYLCSEDHFVSYAPECENPLHCGLDHTQEHYMCAGCELYMCEPAAADLIHNTDACGHWTCTTGYVKAEHAYHEACGKFFCNGGNHEPCPECGKCPEDRFHFICLKCGRHEAMWCVCDRYYCEDCYYSHTCPGFSLPLD